MNESKTENVERTIECPKNYSVAELMRMPMKELTEYTEKVWEAWLKADRVSDLRKMEGER